MEVLRQGDPVFPLASGLQQSYTKLVGRTAHAQGKNYIAAHVPESGLLSNGPSSVSTAASSSFSCTTSQDCGPSDASGLASRSLAGVTPAAAQDAQGGTGPAGATTVISLPHERQSIGRGASGRRDKRRKLGVNSRRQPKKTICGDPVRALVGWPRAKATNNDPPAVPTEPPTEDESMDDMKHGASQESVAGVSSTQSTEGGLSQTQTQTQSQTSVMQIQPKVPNSLRATQAKKSFLPSRAAQRPPALRGADEKAILEVEVQNKRWQTAMECPVSMSTASMEQAVAPALKPSYVSENGFCVVDDYIMTPGRHKIRINDLLMSNDKSYVRKHAKDHPALAAAANYMNDIHAHWRDLEKLIDPGAFSLSYPVKCDVEKFRMMAVQCTFNYAFVAGLKLSTVHMAILNIHRMLHYRICRVKQPLTDELFACTVVAALRTAVKHEEKPEKSDRFKIDPADIWNATDFCKGLPINRSPAKLNQIENECLQILKHPISPPSAPEFLERYLAVGAWPEYVAHYRELGMFLLALAAFVSGEANPLREIPPSKLAAAALVLAVKVINTDASLTSYEYWPEKLVGYTSYDLADLRPGIRGISLLLRNKPPHSGILERVYPRWGSYDWN